MKGIGKVTAIHGIGCRHTGNSILKLQWVLTLSDVLDATGRLSGPHCAAQSFASCSNPTT